MNIARTEEGIFNPYMTRHILEVFKEAMSSVLGFAIAVNVTPIMAKHTNMFVDVPKPLSMICAGTVSSITLGATDIKIPEKNPIKNLKTKISQKFYIILNIAMAMQTTFEKMIN